jgi:hypothetical protein
MWVDEFPQHPDFTPNRLYDLVCLTWGMAWYIDPLPDKGVKLLSLAFDFLNNSNSTMAEIPSLGLREFSDASRGVLEKSVFSDLPSALRCDVHSILKE